MAQKPKKFYRMVLSEVHEDGIHCGDNCDFCCGDNPESEEVICERYTDGGDCVLLEYDDPSNEEHANKDGNYNQTSPRRCPKCLTEPMMDDVILSETIGTLRKTMCRAQTCRCPDCMNTRYLIGMYTKLRKGLK